MTDTTIALSELAEKGADADFIRQTLQQALQRLLADCWMILAANSYMPLVATFTD